MKIVKEFREFSMRGNVIDLAVGIIIGAAFGKIVSSLVNDIIMPPLGLIIGKVSFTDLFVALDGNTYINIAAAREAGAPVLAYGSFIQSLFDFAIIAIAVFMLIKGVNRLNRRRAAEQPESAPAPTKSEELLTEIRDILRKEK